MILRLGFGVVLLLCRIWILRLHSCDLWFYCALFDCFVFNWFMLYVWICLTYCLWFCIICYFIVLCLLVILLLVGLILFVIGLI